jgi:hypothetical protein
MRLGELHAWEKARTNAKEYSAIHKWPAPRLAPSINLKIFFRSAFSYAQEFLCLFTWEKIAFIGHR